MLSHNPEAEKELLALPEGTAVVVDDISGVLVFSPYPEQYVESRQEIYDFIMRCDPYGDTEEEQLENGLYDCLKGFREESKPRKSPLEDQFHLFHRYHDCYEYGIAWVQEEDENVNPRDIGKPSIPKGTEVACYSYPAEAYKIITK